MTTLTAWIATALERLAMTALVQGCVRYQTGYGGLVLTGFGCDCDRTTAFNIETLKIH
jgi:hypothetical protein